LYVFLLDMVIKVDKEKCIGCGLCASMCPAVFKMNDDGKAEVKKADATDKCVSEAKEACPVDAIGI